MKITDSCKKICKSKLSIDVELPLLAVIIGLPLIIAGAVGVFTWCKRRTAMKVWDEILDQYDLVPIAEDCDLEDGCDCGCPSQDPSDSPADN